MMAENANLDTVVPVIDKNTGEQLFKNPDDIDPRTDLIQGDQNQSQYAKYGGFTGEAQNFARQAANTLTLGGYAAIADRFKTPEELRDARKREEFNPISGFIGSVAPYFIPGTGILKTLTGATRIGEAVTGNILARTAIDGALQGFTQGVNEASLDNQLNSETVGNIAYSTLLGGAFGAAVGAVGTVVPPLIGKSKAFIGSKLSKGEAPKIMDELNSVLGEANVAQDKANQIALNKDYLAMLADNPTPETGEFLEKLGARDDLVKLAFDEGHLDLQKYHGSVERLRQLQKDSIIRSNGMEEDPRRFLVETASDGIMKMDALHKEFFKVGSEIEDKFALENINDAVPKNEWQKIQTAVTGDGNSLKKNFDAMIEKISDEKTIREELLRLNPNASEETIRLNTEGILEKYPQDLVKKFKQGMADAYIHIENRTGLEAKDYYKFVDSVLDNLDSSWVAFKGELPFGKKPKPTDSYLYSQLKKPFYKFLTSEEAFGPIGKLRAITKNIRSTINSNSVDLKRIFNIKLDRDFDEVKLKRLRLMGGGSGDLRLRAMPEALKQYADALESGLNEMKLLFPDLDATGETAATLKSLKDTSIQASQDIRLTMNKRISTFWKSVNNAAEKKYAGVGGASLLTRGVRGFEDVISGNLLYAKVQGIRAAIETLARNLHRLNPKTAAEIVYHRGLLMQQVNKVNKSFMDKISTVSENLTKPLKEATRSLGGAAGALPHLMQIKLDSDHKKKVDAQYNQLISNINTTMKNSDLLGSHLQSQLSALGVLDPYLQKIIIQQMQLRAMVIAHNLPKETSAMQGAFGLSTAEKARFLDQVEAILDPERALDLIQNRTIGADALVLYQQFYPALFGHLKQSVIQQMLVKPNIGHKERAYIHSIFGIETGISNMKQNILKSAVPPMPKPQPIQQFRPVGVDKMQNANRYGTPSRQIKP